LETTQNALYLPCPMQGLTIYIYMLACCTNCMDLHDIATFSYSCIILASDCGLEIWEVKGKVT